VRWPWWIAFVAVAALTILAGYCLLRASRPRSLGIDAGAPAVVGHAPQADAPGPPDGGPAADTGR